MVTRTHAEQAVAVGSNVLDIQPLGRQLRHNGGDFDLFGVRPAGRGVLIV